jgi:L-arabinonolactonase
MRARPLFTIDCGDRLGEGIIWDERTGEFLWTDILRRRFHSFDPDSGKHTSHELQRRLCSFSLTAEPDILLAAFDDGIALLNRRSFSQEWLARPEMHPGTRLNDGRTGPDGRFWVGSMVENPKIAGGLSRGSLFCVDADGRMTRHMEGIGISNGICWSPDATIMYFADTSRAEVKTMAYDPVEGILGQESVWLTLTGTGKPDGAVTDDRGIYWLALWGDGCVAGFGPDGRELDRLPIPAPFATCPAFGGPSGNLIAVTTAQARANAMPEGCETAGEGSMFVFETDLSGGPTFRWCGTVGAS